LGNIRFWVNNFNNNLSNNYKRDMKDKLVFKSVDACFEYMEKFFTNA